MNTVFGMTDTTCIFSLHKSDRKLFFLSVSGLILVSGLSFVFTNMKYTLRMWIVVPCLLFTICQPTLEGMSLV